MKEDNSSTVEFKNHLLINQTTGECYETNIEIKKIHNLSIKAKGYRYIYNGEDGILNKCATEKCSSILLLSVIRHIGSDGTLKYRQIDYSKMLDIDIKTVKKNWSIFKKYGLIKQVGMTTYVNPYVTLPYNIKDENANKLQQEWDLLWKKK